MNILPKVSISILLGVAIVYLLFFTADLPNKKDNSFVRNMLKIAVKEIQRKKVHSTIRKIIGISDSIIYFSTEKPNIFITASIDLQNQKKFVVPLPKELISTISSAYSTKLFNKTIHIYGYNVPAIIKIPLSLDSFHVYNIKGGTFSLAEPLSDNEVVLRQHKIGKNNRALLKYSLIDNKYSKVVQLLDSSIFWGIGDDGQLIFNPVTNQVTYIHYYNNRLYNMDTSLFVTKEFTSIDTICPMPITKKVAPLIINQKSTINDTKLYICSNLKADNEDRNEYYSNIPIDVYDVQKAIYLYSFYLPVINGKLIRELFIHNDQIFTIYHGNEYLRFELPKNISQ